MKLISIASLIEYRHQRDQLVEKFSESDFHCEVGRFRLHGFRSILDGRVHYALTLGKISHKSPTLVRVQTANVLTDALGMTSESKSTNMIKRSLAMIRDNGSGALLYMESKKRGFDEGSSKSYSSAKDMLPIPKMDFRDYGIGAQILVELGIEKLSLLTRDNRKVVGLEGYGLEIERILIKYTERRVQPDTNLHPSFSIMAGIQIYIGLIFFSKGLSNVYKNCLNSL